MRDVNVVVLRKVWEAIETVIRNSYDFSSSCDKARPQILRDDIKDGGLGDSWMTRHGAKGNDRCKASTCKSCSEHLLWSIDVGDVITLDPLDIPPSSEPRKRNEDVVG